MRQVEVLAEIPHLSQNEIFNRLRDFNAYMRYSNAVREVEVHSEDANSSISSWEVNFRQGILRWTERDLFYPSTFTICFEQIEGDAAHFSGKWEVTQQEKYSLVRFYAIFDMGIPSLSDMIEPIAEQALRENIKSILVGLLFLSDGRPQDNFR